MLLRYLFLLTLVLTTTACVITKPKTPSAVGQPIDTADPITPSYLEGLVQNAEVQLRGYEEYYLGPGDIVSIYMLGRPDILGDSQGGESGIAITITDSPTISLPLIGEIKVHNKTAGELQQELEVAYSEFVKEPRPLVIIRHFHRNQVSILGTVNAPGKYPYEFGDTVLDAVFKAGGLSAGGRGGGMAPGRYLRIYRERIQPNVRAEMSLEQLIDAMTNERGEIQPREEIIVPVDELALSGSLRYNIPVAPNDILYIAPAGSVHVQGRVYQPGVVFLGPSVFTLTHVLWERGGLRYSADSIVEVVRTDENGESISYFLHARRMMGRRIPDFRMQDGDQVFVYATPARDVLEFLGNLFQGSIRTGASATYTPVP